MERSFLISNMLATRSINIIFLELIWSEGTKSGLLYAVPSLLINAY